MKIRSMISWFSRLAIAWAAASIPARAAEPAGRPEPGTGPQVPSALAWGPGGLLHVALRDARRVVAVDPRTWAVVSGSDVPIRPISLALADDRSTLLLGGVDGHVVVLDPSGRVVLDLAVGRGPARVLPLPGGRAAVATRWDPVLRLIDWRRGRVLAEHPLRFAPGALVRRPDGRVVVADAFGNAFTDLAPGDVGGEKTFTLEGVNLLALAISGDGKELLIAHMYQEDAVPITASNIDGGRVLSSRLGAIRLADLEGESPPESPRQPPCRTLTLDGPVHGAADPTALALSPDGTKVVIALGGAHQVLLNDRAQGVATSGAADLLPLGHNQRLGVVEVGRGPVAVVMDPTGTLAVTADAMSDTLTVVRISDRAKVARVSLGPRPPVRTPAQRGEVAFHDGRRSHDRWMSCASCHPGGHTSGLNFDTFGDSGFGAPKNTPSLLGVAATQPFTWTGKFDRLADQVHQSFETSLRGPEPEPGLVEDLVAYLESLPPPPPRRSPGDPSARRGAEVFRSRRCHTCHAPPLYTIAATRDVGLDDGAGGHRRFNPPTLRGVSWTAPYLHDGRAANFSDLLQVHTPGKTDPLDPADRDDLIAFLESL
jgi:cytochrome c peroxidase